MTTYTCKYKTVILSCLFGFQDQLRFNNKGSDSDADKLELYQALEKAEARIQSLERQVRHENHCKHNYGIQFFQQHIYHDCVFFSLQLAENSRSWGKERADMSLRLNEAEHGFGRSAGMVLHDYPVYVSTDTQWPTAHDFYSPIPIYC